MSFDDLIVRDSQNNETLSVYVDEYNDTELCNLFNELRENTTVKKAFIGTDYGGPGLVLGLHPSLALAAAISQNPTLNKIQFYRLDRINTCFGAIAVAIQQKKSFVEVGLSSCDLSQEQMEVLEWLLAENGLESMVIDGCYPENDDREICLAQGLCSNASLKKLTIENVEVENGEEIIWSLATETIEAIPHLLRRNKIIESLDLKYVDFPPPESIIRIAEAVVEHESLSKLILQEIGEAGAKELPSLFHVNSGLKTMNLGSNNLSDAEAVALSSPLKVNARLKVLDLACNEVGAEGACAIAEALLFNVSLNKIYLYNNPIGDDGAAALAQALTVNTTLTELSVSNFGERGLISFASCLPLMNGLKKLTIHDLNELTKEGADAFLRGIERNTELEDTILTRAFYTGHRTRSLCKEMMPKIKYQMTLNRAGKRILKSESRVPDALWPLILARSSKTPDALYFFLREKPDVLINKAPPVRASRKRKRGWFGGWF